MFRKNKKHQQPALISAASELPEKQLKRLKNSWADTFYNEFFKRIEEETFSVLYSAVGSRPNVPVNVLVGLEALKAGYGWSDEELYENYCYNLQVRYALGYDRLGDGDFEIRTLYNFRERLSRYNIEQEANLLEKAFEQIADAQIKTLKVHTGLQRMDSTQIASNIVSASRLQLLVESIQRVERILKEEDRERLSEKLEPYTCDSAGHYTYRIKGKDAVQDSLTTVGQLMRELICELHEAYGEQPAFQVMKRLFDDNFILEEHNYRPKANEEMSSDSLQSVDDLEATYRTKGKNGYKGYVANITETCDPENQFQLITKVQVTPNKVDDTTLLEEALPGLKERTKIKTLYTDGGYGSPVMDKKLQDEKIEQIQTGIRGRIPDENKLNLSDFEIKQAESGKPIKITCPQGQTVSIQTSSQKKGYVAHFDASICSQCPLAEKCPAQKGKRDDAMHLRFSESQMHVSRRRRKNMTWKKEAYNLRAAVESTVRQVKHSFANSKLPVRGLFRVSCMIFSSAMACNLRRIHKFKTDSMKSTMKLQNCVA